jgi:hypothetical protein
MKNKYLIGIGVIALGVFAYSRYAKKDDSGQEEDQGGGGGGGSFLGGLIIDPITNQPTTPSTPAKVGITPTKITNPTILKNLGANKPTAATTSSTGAGAQSGVTNTGVIKGTGGGINPVVSSGLGSSKPVSASTSSTGVGNTGVGVGNTGGMAGMGTTMTGTAGGTVFKPFDGCEPNRRRTLFLSDLVRSWNRP